jgi:hypothetical protein
MLSGHSIEGAKMSDAVEFVAIVSFVLGAFGAWIQRRLMPLVEVRISPRWDQNAPDVLILGLELQNKSAVKVRRLEAQLQVLKHHLPKAGFLPDRIPFEREAFDAIPERLQPTEWNVPFEVVGAIKLEPGEIARAEVLYRCSPATSALHCGFRFRYALDFPLRILYLRRDDRCTTTAWIVAPELQQRSAAVAAG